MNILINWIISALVVIASAYILPGVTVDNFFVAFITALVIGLINTFIRPAILLLTLPITILTLGLFSFVINALLILLASAIVPGFEVAGFWWALLFSLVLAVANHFVGTVMTRRYSY
ncbi:phage holin family protein [Candidatus Giovannonibacteria bacterium]|nr:phage holin family protein [Candidatus Giovannonibacteria bacterium]